VPGPNRRAAIPTPEIQMTLPTGRRRAARIAAAALVALLAACTALREPAYDPAIAGAVTELAVESQELFARLSAASPAPLAGRAPLYARLSARARSIATLAETRPAGGPVPLSATGAGALAGLLLRPGRPPPEETGGGPYRDATPAFMADYLRNLGWLEAADRADPASPPPPAVTRLRIAALTEVLRDALTYERRILGRGRPHPSQP
jgi:hypothetical protein